MKSRLLLLLFAATPALGRAQIIRDPDKAGAAPADPLTAEGAAKVDQTWFERFRLAHLQAARGGGRPSNCDEIVGKFCYWYDEKEGSMPREAPEIAQARDTLIHRLDSLAKVAPDDQWIVAQRVRYLVEAKRPADALIAANQCQVGGWWCDILIGFAQHALGQYVAAEQTYNGALAKMLPRDRCVWRDMSMLIDDDTRQEYHRLQCGDPKRTAFEDRTWFLARQLYSNPGNDSRTEWYARMTMTYMLQDAASPHQFGFDDDERELLLRFGWPVGWALGGRDPRTHLSSIESAEMVPAYRMIPPGYVLNNPPLSDSTNWAVQLPPVYGRYAPPYARNLRMLEHQKAMFHRGDSALVLMAYDTRMIKPMEGKPVTAALVLSNSDAKKDYARIVHNAPPTGVLTVTAPWGSLLMSAEVSAPSVSTVSRARYGVSPPFAVGTRVTLSDLLFYKPYGQFPTTVEEAAPHAHTTERLRADEKLGVYWEAYGTDPQGEKMKISLTVVKEVEESGFLRRQAKALKLEHQATPVSVSVEDLSARGTATSTRALELDIHTLTKGAYIVQLEIEVDGQYVIRADHRIEIITP
jgi:hypothetical protein